MSHKVIGVTPKGVNAADRSQHGVKSLASSQNMSNQSRRSRRSAVDDLEDC
jgi:hypothetical protein